MSLIQLRTSHTNMSDLKNIHTFYSVYILLWDLIKSLEQSRSVGRSASTWVTLIPSWQNQPAQRSDDVPWFPVWSRAQQLLAPSGGPEVPGEVLPEPQDPASHQGESSCCWSHSEGNNLFVLLLLLFIITVNSLNLSHFFNKDTNIVWFLSFEFLVLKDNKLYFLVFGMIGWIK